MSNRNSDSTGHKSDVGNRSSIGNSSQRPQSKTTGPSTTSATSPANRNSTSGTSTTKAPNPKPSFSAAAAGGKPPAHVPVRTNSAPPEEHPGDASSKSQQSHFVPTKTTSQLTGTATEVSYRSALGIKNETTDQKPKATSPEQPPQEKAQPQPEPQPEKAPPSQPAQPEVSQALVSNDVANTSNDANNNASSENVDKSSQYNREGSDHRGGGEYRNSNRINNSNNPRRTNRSDSFGGSGNPMGNNRPPRNPQQQQQQIGGVYQQQQQTPQYTPQQMQYFAQQQQLQFFQQYAAWLTLPQPQFQAAISQYSPEQQQYWWAQYRAYQAYAQQYQYQAAAAAYSQMYYGQAQYQQQQPYYTTAATGVQAGIMPNYQVQYAGYQTSPQLTGNPGNINAGGSIPYNVGGGKHDDNNQMMQNAVVANNPVIHSSPVVNTTPIITSSTPTTQTPVITVKPEPEVPVPLEIPAPRHEEVHQPVVPKVEPPAAPKIEIVPPKPSKKIVIKDKFGNEVNLADLKSSNTAASAAAASNTQQQPPAADKQPADDAKTASDKPKEAVAVDSAKTDSSKQVEAPKPAVTATVEQAIPDLPVEVARPKKARAPTIDEPAPPTKEVDQPSFPVEKPVREENNAPPGLPPGLKKDGADNWEDNTTSAQEPAPVADAPGLGRRLVQGNKLSHAHGKLAQPVAKKVYTKAEILALRPEGDFKANLLGNISVAADGGAGHGKGGGGGNYSGGRGRGGGGGGREGREIRGGGNYGSGDGTPTTGEAPGWTREALPPIQTGGKKGKGPASPVPPPKKKEVDPVEILAQEATLLLNQIAPKTFDLFCQKLLDLPLKNTAMLDRVVELIFEKAIYDTAFVEMYAELCLQLKERSAWTFFTIVKLEEGEFCWIRDFSFPEEVAGPYYSRQDALNAFSAAEIPAMKPMSISPSNIKQSEVLLTKAHFIKIVQKNEGEWFVTGVPEATVPFEQRAQSLFNTDKEASKDATTELSFRGRLAHSCEIEFQKSVKDESLFEAVDEDYKQLRAKRATLTQDEFDLQEAEILERRFKIKRRMLANIRFVGELYKKKLLNTETMHDCIVELLGHPPNWKAVYEEEDLELLCDLLSTVGETLEGKSKKLKKDKADYMKKFDQYFDKLKLLSKDKSLISRIRFRIESVIDLRNNNWVKRTGAPVAAATSEPAQKERAGGAPSTSSSSAQPRILNRQDDRYNTGGTGGGRPTSQRDPYERDGRGGPGGRDGPDNRSGGRYGGQSSGYDDRDYGRGGGRGGGGDDRRYRNEPAGRQAPPSSNTASSTGSGKLAPPAVASEDSASSLQFDQDSKVRKGVAASVDEILSGIEIGELNAMLKESSPLHTGFFIHVLLEKYSNAHSKEREKLLSLLDDGELISWLISNRAVLERAIEQYSPLMQLVDTSVDIIQAPELFGTVVGKLVKINAVHASNVEKLVGKWSQFNIEEMGCMQEDVDKVFNRFLSKLH